MTTADDVNTEALAERHRSESKVGSQADSLPEWFEALSPPSAALLRRASLLDAGEELDAVIVNLLLFDFTAESDRQEAMESLRGFPGITSGDGGVQISAELRDFASSILHGSEDEQAIGEIRTRIRQWRMTQRGVQPRSRLTRDYWTTRDDLAYRPYAEAIAAFIRHRDSRPPLTIGIRGAWGAGKTSLMRMIREELDPPGDGDRPRPIELTDSSRRTLRPRGWLRRTAGSATDPVTNAEVLQWSKAATGDPHSAVPLDVEPELGDAALRPADWRPTVWFNPWAYQSTEQVWAGLAHAIITQVTDRLEPGDRERFWLQLNLARMDRLAVRRRAYRLVVERLLPYAVMFVIAVLAAAVIWLAGLGQDVARWVAASGAGALTAGGLLRYLFFRRERASIGFGRLLAAPALRVDTADAFDVLFPDPGYAAKAGFLHLVHEDMNRVLALVASERRPLVVFVDDLDRCSPGVVGQVIEALNLFLAGQYENCVFVLAMEPDVVAAHVEVAYRDLVEKLQERGQGEALGWRFLDKIVQLPLHLPAVDEDAQIPAFVRAQFDLPPQEAEVGDDARAAEQPELADRAQVAHVGAMPPVVLRPGPLGAPMMMPDPGLVGRVEERIRQRRPTLETLPEAARAVAGELTAAEGIIGMLPPSDLANLAAQAADRVFADLYGDAAAYDAISAALPALKSSNPREIKRYLNLFRFYAFIAFRRKLDGAPVPDNGQIAKIAALAIRWPHLLSGLSSENDAGVTTLRLLEDAAVAGDDTAWSAAGGPGDSRLRVLLASVPRIAHVSRGLL